MQDSFLKQITELNDIVAAACESGKPAYGVTFRGLLIADGISVESFMKEYRTRDKLNKIFNTLAKINFKLNRKYMILTQFPMFLRLRMKSKGKWILSAG